VETRRSNDPDVIKEPALNRESPIRSSTTAKPIEVVNVTSGWRTETVDPLDRLTKKETNSGQPQKKLKPKRLDKRPNLFNATNF
jgi:hypothetical protein